MSKVVLCVDDESTGLHVRRLILEHSGYRVLTALGAAEALSIFRKEAVDLVLLDYFMPGVDGGQAAAQMKALKPQVPIIMLSAYLSLPNSVLQHVDAFITKGEPVETLLNTIVSLLEKP